VPAPIDTGSGSFDDGTAWVVDVGAQMTNVCAYLADSAARHPDARAVVCDHTTTSYSEFYSQVSRFAEYLTQSDVQPGDQLALMLPNGVEFSVIFYGVLHAGGVVVPLSPAVHARTARHALANARRLFVTPRHMLAGTVAAVAAGTQLTEIGSNAIADLTTGFLGRSALVIKAACDAAIVFPAAGRADSPTARATHGELVSSQAITAGLLPLGPGDVVMGCLPMTERVGIACGLLTSMFSGSTLVLPSFDPALDPATTLETIADEQITVIEGSPAMYVALLDAAHHDNLDFSSLRVCVSAGGRLPQELLRRFEDRFGCAVVDADELLALTQPSRLGAPDMT
jgi:long-chain acyl-CoA synthetase